MKIFLLNMRNISFKFIIIISISIIIIIIITIIIISMVDKSIDRGKLSIC